MSKSSTTQFWQVPTLEEMLAEKSEYYPFTKTYDEAERDQAIIIHSSGSTGKTAYVQGCRIMT